VKAQEIRGARAAQEAGMSDEPLKAGEVLVRDYISQEPQVRRIVKILARRWHYGTGRYGVRVGEVCGLAVAEALELVLVGEAEGVGWAPTPSELRAAALSALKRLETDRTARGLSLAFYSAQERIAPCYQAIANVLGPEAQEGGL
jgi:hypothetical protein